MDTSSEGMLMVAYVGPERRLASKDERHRYAQENGMDESGMKIVFTPKSLAALVLALIVAAGGGTFALKHSEAGVPNERLAVVETKLELLTQSVKERFDEQARRTDETNRLLRGLTRQGAERAEGRRE